uniref:Uncharacterized protein n=1 Tax=Arundo donax TaxID=35708 RepID=A0A0A9ETD7_ARUDO
MNHLSHFQLHWMSILSNEQGLLQPSSDKLTNPETPSSLNCRGVPPSICTAAVSAAALSSMSAPGWQQGRSPSASSCSPPGKGSPP